MMAFPNDIKRQTEIQRGVKVEVSSDGYEAYVTAEEENLQPIDIQAALEAYGIVYGVDSKAIIEAPANRGSRVLVATGSRHEDGKDAWFEVVKNREESPENEKFGIRNIYAGETIGIIHKSTAGSVGVDVYGRKVQPKEGKKINIFAGPNVKRIETDDQIIFEATADGNLRLSSSSVEVITEHVIRGDVDYSDGEIEFAGTLKIYGDVKGSGNLRVKHDVFIQGSVEDAKIISGGNVTVKGSFVGRGDGLIKAAGNVDVYVVLNQMVEAGGSITVIKEAVNAHLIAVNEIYGKTATVMGGIVAAGNKIEVRTLGGELYSTTKVRLGMQELLGEDLKAIEKEIEIQSRATEEIKSQIYLLVRDRIDGNNFTSEKADHLKLLQSKLKEMNEVINQLNAKKQETSVEMSRKRSPKLVVTGTIHQSVVAEINGVRFALKQSYNNVTFEESKGEIVRTKNLEWS
jgi:uncharacterized protein (DUF342 family)